MKKKNPTESVTHAKIVKEMADAIIRCLNDMEQELYGKWRPSKGKRKNRWYQDVTNVIHKAEDYFGKKEGDSLYHRHPITKMRGFHAVWFEALFCLEEQGEVEVLYDPNGYALPQWIRLPKRETREKSPETRLVHIVSLTRGDSKVLDKFEELLAKLVHLEDAEEVLRQIRQLFNEHDIELEYTRPVSEGWPRFEEKKKKPKLKRYNENGFPIINQWRTGKDGSLEINPAWLTAEDNSPKE